MTINAAADVAASVETLEAILEAFNAHDLEAIMEFFTDDCSFDQAQGPAPWGRRLIGKKAIREAFAARFAAMPDAHYAADRHAVSGDFGVSEWLLTGTTADGQQHSVRGVDHWEFRGAKVARKDAYLKSA
ncbi:nuclear transport factor 2 family protein [Paenarthrobacter sp. NPDC089989]|uniref:nuclear transport factor 2 family protein n=1 Tax=unclassified Paenarthrobacter TaxID=2634190 RepID=UPI003830D411